MTSKQFQAEHINHVCLSWIHQGDVNIMLHKSQKKYFFLSRLSLDNIQLMTLDEVNTTIYQPQRSDYLPQPY